MRVLVILVFSLSIGAKDFGGGQLQNHRDLARAFLWVGSALFNERPYRFNFGCLENLP